MKKIRPVFPGTIGILIALVLVAGCYRPAAPDVTSTPAGGAEAAPSEEEVMATGAAESTRAAQTPEGDEGAATETPTETAPAPTPTPSPPPATPTPTPTTPAPTTSAPTTPAPTATPSSSEPVTHMIRRGENLFRIALRYGVTVEAIASANGITNPARIYAGQTLTIPSPGAQPSLPSADETTYVVQPGDNLFRIALRYNMSHLYLAQHNGIANPSSIYAGQVLRIPPH